MGSFNLQKSLGIGDVKRKDINSCKIKNMINKTKKFSYLIFKYSFNFLDCFLIIIFLTKIKTEKNNNILIKNIFDS